MPPFFDEAQIHNALRNEALPELARLADNEGLRDRAVRRFDRDEPPPYVSSTEDDDEFGYEPPLGFEGGAVLDEFADLITPPLNDAERDSVATDLSYHLKVYNPGERYHKEALFETERVRTLRWKLRPTNAEAERILDFQGRPGDERVNIIVRRNIKRRWQKLGVWNPRWGIPGRRNSTNPDDDDKSKWKWRWQHGDDAAEWTMSTTPTATNPHHPITRAVMLRRGLHRGEHAPVLPRPRLPPDAPASQAESFIISRPWFIFEAEFLEERQRFHRIPTQRRRHHTDSMAKPVIEWWKSRGDWRDDWSSPVDRADTPGWKWRHESPSPEPEDLTPLETMDLEFTPSEVDALEAIAPPTPPPRPPSPRRYYPRGHPKHVPGTGLFATPPPPDLPPAPPYAGSEPEGPEGPEPNPRAPTPPRRRSRRQKDKEPPQPHRRSARIAALNQARALPPPERQPATRATGRQPPAGRPKRGRPARTGGQVETTASKRPRGRPRKRAG
ncbi:hypothetical protein C8A01DRAFT_40701 [Parachaetomium inaequale]|uniref:Uncharacterized protein n=1 Tax=Parachaetomium inaequale TaxID=2588326 RepID=A0AAN6P6W9_9PEZI|nr:hypothetical protein C8A01DRAFT_40701 [Parachaetomium inaequale]